MMFAPARISIARGPRVLSFAVLAVLIALLCPIAGAASEDAEPFAVGPEFVPYVGARIGYIELEEVDDDGSVSFGLTGGVFFRPRWSAEASLDFQESEFFVDLGNVAVSVPLTRRETWALQVGLAVTPWPDRAVRPYAIGGVGYFWSRYDTDYGYEPDRIGDGGYFWGAGVDLFGDDQDLPLSLVLEARWLFTRKEDYFEERGIRADGFTVSVGARFRLR